MHLRQGERLCGFLVTRGRFIPEQSGTLYELIHEKTGAGLCYMDTADENKLFYAAFKTLPFDDTGVFHILEHSVLCGSALYPVREPFVELLKSSMQTFLNALTFPDKTVYPCASRNEKDFLQLMRVYLDAVFAPRCTSFENIFLQEGWHLESAEGVNAIKGVVYNEMKGAMSDQDRILESEMLRLLFPDSPYRFISGGDPVSIPSLTFESFRQTYARFYHPSNCRLYLDGSVPLEKALQLIGSYLDRFERLPALPEIPMQPPVANSGTTCYEIQPEETETGKTHFAFGRLFDTWADKEKSAAMLLLIDVLTDSNSSPLKQAIIENDLGEDVDVNLDTGIAQNMLSIIIRNTDAEKRDAILSAWTGAVQKLMEEGLKKEDIEARLASMEYRFREINEPAGLHRGLSVLDSWLYGGDPALYLGYEELLSSLRERMERGGFDELLQELLPDKPGTCFLTLLPSKTLGEEKRRQEQAFCNAMAEGESAEEREQRLNKISALQRWQSTPDTQQQLSTLPKLMLADLPKTLTQVPTQCVKADGYAGYLHKMDTHGIVYAGLNFRLTDIPAAELAALNFYAALLTELPTKHYPDARELQREIRLCTGSVTFNIFSTAPHLDAGHAIPFFAASVSTVPRMAERAAALLRELLLYTDVSDGDAIRSILLQEKYNEEMNLISRGHSVAIGEAMAGFTAQAAVEAAYGPRAYCNYLSAFSEDFEGMLPQFRSIVARFTESSLCRKRMTVTYTGLETDSYGVFAEGFPLGSAVPESTAYAVSAEKDTGIEIPAAVGYAGAGWLLRPPFPASRGSLAVAAKVLSLDTLWNRVRVGGGAYGAGFSVTRENCFFMYSYRDPTPAASLGIFKTLAEALADWCEKGESPERFIISTAADMDPLLAPASAASLEDTRLLSGYSFDGRLQIWQELLSADTAELKKWVPVFRRFAEECHTCLVGPGALIAEQGRILKKLI